MSDTLSRETYIAFLKSLSGIETPHSQDYQTLLHHDQAMRERIAALEKAVKGTMGYNILQEGNSKMRLEIERLQRELAEVRQANDHDKSVEAMTIADLKARVGQLELVNKQLDGGNDTLANEVVTYKDTADRLLARVRELEGALAWSLIEIEQCFPRLADTEQYIKAQQALGQQGDREA